MATSSEAGKSKLGKGYRLQSQSKEIVCNVFDYFNKLHAKGKSTGPLKRTEEATGLCNKSI